jgi:hypothetical protein
MKMSEDQIRFNILFRRPKYPVIVISSDELSSAYDIDQLAAHCFFSEPLDNEIFVKVIDSTGEEFWYSPEHVTLSPGMAFKRWTKKRIIELYNNSPKTKENNSSYPIKSLSSKKLSRIISDICDLLL